MKNQKFVKNQTLDVEKLKIHAELLDSAIKSHLGKSADVDFLAGSPALASALDGARRGSIKLPIKLGLGRWSLDSNIRDYPEISSRLSEFSLLLEGWELPDEGR